MRIAMVVVAVLGGCSPELAVVRCEDGTVCPIDLECPRPGDTVCFDPDAHCVDKPVGESCTPEIGGDGTCDGQGACIPVTCGDGVVQEREICEPMLGPDENCFELGFDFGRSRCASDCSGSESATCGLVGWKDLRMYAESGLIYDVEVVDGVVWAVGDHGVYREQGSQWAKVLDGTFRFIVHANDGVYVFDQERQIASRFDGAAWTDEALPPVPGALGPSLTFAEVGLDGQPVVGSGPGFLRRSSGTWNVVNVPTSSDAVISGLGAFAVLGDIEIVAQGELFISGFPPEAYNVTRMFDAQTLEQHPSSFDVSVVGSIAGRSLDDYTVSGRFYPPLAGPTEFRTRRITGSSSGSATVTPLPGSGWITMVGDSELIVPIEPIYASEELDPNTYGSFVRGSTGMRVEIPARAIAMANKGGRIVIAIDGGVFELGDALWSPPPTVVDSPSSVVEVTTVGVLDIAATPNRDQVWVVDRRNDVNGLKGLVWRALSLAQTPTLNERTRSLHGTMGAWSDGTNYVTITNSPQTSTNVHHFPLGGSLPSGGEFNLPVNARDIGGNASIDDGEGNLTMDMMVVGMGATPAFWFDGAAWTPTIGVPAGVTELAAVAGASAGSYVAVGANGVVGKLVAGAWETVDAQTTAALFAVDAIGTSFVAVGDGVAVRCDDTGCQRDELPSQLRSVSMGAADDIIAVGGDALHFDGMGWTRMRLGFRPSHAVISGPVVWFGDASASGGMRRMVRVRPWR